MANLGHYLTFGFGVFVTLVVLYALYQIAHEPRRDVLVPHQSRRSAEDWDRKPTAEAASEIDGR